MTVFAAQSFPKRDPVATAPGSDIAARPGFFTFCAVCGFSGFRLCLTPQGKVPLGFNEEGEVGFFFAGKPVGVQ